MATLCLLGIDWTHQCWSRTFYNPSCKVNIKKSISYLLSSVLDTSCYALHCKDESVLEARWKLSGWVQCDQLHCTFHRFKRWPRLAGLEFAAVLFTHFLQCERLLNVEGSDVRLSQSQTLLQGRVSLQNIRVPCNLYVSHPIHVNPIHVST